MSMKISFEIDITPEEVKEIFDGNMEVLQRSLMELFMRQMANTDKAPSNTMMAFWQSMAEQSASMFQQYQHDITGGSPKKK